MISFIFTFFTANLKEFVMKGLIMTYVTAVHKYCTLISHNTVHISVDRNSNYVLQIVSFIRAELYAKIYDEVKTTLFYFIQLLNGENRR